MISHLFLHQGRESFFILALTSSTGKCDAARVILATFLFSSSAHNFCENSTTARNLVLLSEQKVGETGIIPEDSSAESKEEHSDTYEDGHVSLTVEPTYTSTNDD